MTRVHLPRTSAAGCCDAAVGCCWGQYDEANRDDCYSCVWWLRLGLELARQNTCLIIIMDECCCHRSSSCLQQLPYRDIS
jgi:hypothetical protein